MVNCVKKANFAVHYVQEMLFRLEKKNSVDRLNFKAKVIDNIPR